MRMGLQSNSIFNDTFELLEPSNIIMEETDLAWEVDREVRFGNPSNYPEFCNSGNDCAFERFPGVLSQSLGNLDEHFMVWMRVAALSTFMNKYGRIGQNLDKGTKLVFQVTSRFVVSPFDGGKSLIVTTDSWIGGRNDFLGLAYIAMGALVVVTVIVMTIKECVAPRQFGTAEMLQMKAEERDVVPLDLRSNRREQEDKKSA